MSPDAYIQLSIAISHYCHFQIKTKGLWATDKWHRSLWYRKGRVTLNKKEVDEYAKQIDVRVVYELWELLVQVAPNTFMHFCHLPPSLQVEQMITAIVTQMPYRTEATLWDEYFLRGGELKDVAKSAGISMRATRHHIAKFPETVARQILLLESTRVHVPTGTLTGLVTQTYPQRCAAALERTFRLTERESEVLLVYMDKPKNQPRWEMADELCISTNTLKSRIRNLVRKMKVSSMFNAVAKARPVLADVPPD